MFICLSETVNQDDLVRKDTHWWTDLVDEEKHKTMLEISGKLVLLFEILRMAEGLGDKVLVLFFIAYWYVMLICLWTQKGFICCHITITGLCSVRVYYHWILLRNFSSTKMKKLRSTGVKRPIDPANG